MMKVILLTSLILFFANSTFSQQHPDCVRSLPEPILKKSVFPKKTFVLRDGVKDNPAKRGFEKTKISNDVDLTIENSGCENYSLSFEFTVRNINRNVSDTKFWYNKSIELMNLVKKGIRSQDINLINRGLKAISNYNNKTRKPVYETYIDFGKTEIRDIVVFNGVRKQKNGYKVIIGFGIGPL